MILLIIIIIFLIIFLYCSLVLAKLVDNDFNVDKDDKSDII